MSSKIMYLDINAIIIIISIIIIIITRAIQKVTYVLAWQGEGRG